MPRQRIPAELNKLVAGLNTEASPLTFPENASIDELNFELDKSGERRRRLGLEVEDGFEIVGQNSASTVDPGISTFRWENVANDPELVVLVVQYGSSLTFYDMSLSPLELIGSVSLGAYKTEGLDAENSFSFTVVGEELLVATGYNKILRFTISAVDIPNRTGYNVNQEDDVTILTRDFFGVDDGRGLNERPTTVNTPYTVDGVTYPGTGPHIYNLRNQGWALPKLITNYNGGPFNPTTPLVAEDENTLVDPIHYFQQWRDIDLYPSHADIMVNAVYPSPVLNGSAESQLELDKFQLDYLIDNVVESAQPPLGHFIIDVLDRGDSRHEANSQLEVRYAELTTRVGALPDDKPQTGARAVAEYSGRVWYAGFGGEIVDKDKNSPNLTSYVFFSQLTKSAKELGKCYQEGDPTSKDTAELLDTDGGFINLSGAYDIKAMVNIGTGLVVLASNGVWVITGGSDYGFTANDYKVDKVSSHGCLGPGSVVEVDSTVIYWSLSGIYHLAPNEFGEVQTNNLTNDTIQSFYNAISHTDRKDCEGMYDPVDKKVRWVYGNSITSDRNMELTLDLTLGAFYPHEFYQDPDGFPKVISPFRTPPFAVGAFDTDLVNDEDEVVYGAQSVIYSQRKTYDETSQVKYVAYDQQLIEFSFPLIDITWDRLAIVTKSNEFFRDWIGYSESILGIDAPAYMITGYLPSGDFQRTKQVPWITFHFNKTENGFVTGLDGEITPLNESSCLVQAQWDWTNSANSNKWGTEFQAYRHKRYYLPANDTDGYDDGHSVVSTKNKVRGKGKVLSLYMRTQEFKDLQFLGLSSIIEVNQNV